MIDTYTRLLEVVAETEDKKAADAAVEKLIKHLKSAGRVKMLAAIARELRKVAARRALRAPVVEVSSKKEEPAALRAAGKLGIHAKHAMVNPALVSGWRARSAGTLVDRSAKRALIELYKNVTSV